MLGALAAAVVVFPIVTIAWWNALIAGALAVATLVCLIVARRMRRLRRWEASDSTPSAMVLDAVSLPPSDLYLLDTRYSNSSKVLGLLITVTLGLAGLLALGATVANFAALKTPAGTTISLDSAYPISLIVCFVGIIGALSGTAPLAVNRSSLRADAQGLSQQIRLYRVQTRWSEITEIHIYVRAGKVMLYGVRRTPGEPVIAWSCVKVRPRHVPSGATIITPEQLAALVASRTNAAVLLHELPR